MSQVTTVLFACPHNAFRSILAAGLFNLNAKQGFVAISAGITPADTIQPEVVEALKEVGLDISSDKPQLITQELQESADLVLPIGCKDKLPVQTSNIIEIPFIPGGKSIDEVRVMRGKIQEQVIDLLNERGWAK